MLRMSFRSIDAMNNQFLLEPTTGDADDRMHTIPFNAGKSVLFYAFSSSTCKRIAFLHQYSRCCAPKNITKMQIFSVANICNE
jgi:hypothetical protein